MQLFRLISSWVEVLLSGLGKGTWYKQGHSRLCLWWPFSGFATIISALCLDGKDWRSALMKGFERRNTLVKLQGIECSSG